MSSPGRWPFHLVEDALQLSMIKASRHIGKLETASFKQVRKWLLTTTENELKDEYKRRRSKKFANLASDEALQAIGETGNDNSVFIEVLEALRGCVDKLSPDDRALIVGRYWSETPLKELAQSLQLNSDNAVSKKLMTIRDRLSDCVKGKTE